MRPRWLTDLWQLTELNYIYSKNSNNITRNSALQRSAVYCGYGMDWSYLLVVCALNVSFHYNDNATAIPPTCWNATVLSATRDPFSGACRWQSWRSCWRNVDCQPAETSPTSWSDFPMQETVSVMIACCGSFDAQYIISNHLINSQRYVTVSCCFESLICTASTHH